MLFLKLTQQKYQEGFSTSQTLPTRPAAKRWASITQTKNNAQEASCLDDGITSREKKPDKENLEK